MLSLPVPRLTSLFPEIKLPADFITDIAPRYGPLRLRGMRN